MTYKPKAPGLYLGRKPKKGGVFINRWIDELEREGYEEIILPSIEPQQVYLDKAGPEILNQMYVFDDKKGRKLCLRPEGTATVQLLADKHFKGQEKKLWYLTKCWRYERPQAGRYREFWQFGVEWLNPKGEGVQDEIIRLAEKLMEITTLEYNLEKSVTRGLEYYVEDGFEVSVESLGAQKQVLGGGRYKQGIGFALGVDRIMLALET